jgi:type II secretory pathway component PulC
MKTRRPLLVIAILWIATTNALAADSSPQRDVHPGAAPVSPLAAQESLDQLSATRDRPLFSPTRRPPAPPPVVVPAAPPPPPPPEVALLGVVMDGDDARAVVRVAQQAKTIRVQIGDDIGGWKVGQIEARYLVLLLNGRTAKFTMFSGKSTKRFPPAGSIAPSQVSQRPNLVQQGPTSTNGSALPHSQYSNVRRHNQQQQ